MELNLDQDTDLREGYMVQKVHRWQIDGYDKLKPFGFCIHSAIDGYRRRVLWLVVSSSSNDPEIVGKYHIDYADVIGGTARIIRADRGTENVNVEAVNAAVFSQIIRG